MASPTRPPALGGGGVLLQISAGLLVAGIVFTAGLIAGLPLGHAKSSAVDQKSAAVTYDKVRAANIGLFEQALSHVSSDCRAGHDRCSLSLAYAPALDQKFQDELAAIAVPACADDYDRQLRNALRRLEDSLEQAAQGIGSTSVVVAGLYDLQALDQTYAKSGCSSST